MMRTPLIFDWKTWALAAKYVQQGKLLDLKNDVNFKSFFGGSSKESMYCRCKMISAVIGKKVTSAVIVNPQLTPLRFKGKYPTLDLRCTLEDGSEVDVEIQGKYYRDEFINRTLYYTSRLVAETLDSGSLYKDMPHVYQITFANFSFIDDTSLHHSYTFREDTSKDQLTDMVQIHFIEMQKLKNPTNTPKESLSDLQFWAMIVFGGDDPKVQNWLSQFKEHTEELNMVNLLLKRLSRNRRDWARYIFADKPARDIASRTEIELRQVREEGREEGAHNRAVKVARNLLKINLSPEQIADVVDLPVEEIRKLQ
ncbi:MAG: Rpn family recombination-promoting nuclease/putative transposase [Treponema sp.]|nr:Rpn family recombination-promoting nuclease/putative transposase [Treponema sp.]